MASDYPIDRVVNAVVAVRIRTENEKEFSEQLAEIARNGLGTWGGCGRNGGYSVSHTKPDLATLAGVDDPQAFVEAVRNLVAEMDKNNLTEMVRHAQYLRAHLGEKR